MEQIGRPEEVYRRPATPFVARFLGRANFLAGTVAEIEASGAVVALDGGGFSIVAGQRPGLARASRCSVVIRQENIRLAPADAERPTAPTTSRRPSSSTPSRDRPTTTWSQLGGRARARGRRAWRDAAAGARGAHARRVAARRRDPAARASARAARARGDGTDAAGGCWRRRSCSSLVAFVAAGGDDGADELASRTSRWWASPAASRSRHYTKLLTDSYYLEIIGRTLALGLTVTLLHAGHRLPGRLLPRAHPLALAELADHPGRLSCCC